MDEFLPPDENLLGLMIEICAGVYFSTLYNRN